MFGRTQNLIFFWHASCYITNVHSDKVLSMSTNEKKKRKKKHHSIFFFFWWTKAENSRSCFVSYSLQLWLNISSALGQVMPPSIPYVSSLCVNLPFIFSPQVSAVYPLRTKSRWSSIPGCVSPPSPSAGDPTNTPTPKCSTSPLTSSSTSKLTHTALHAYFI